MATLKVTVNKLNVRKSPVLDFANKENIVGVLHKDAVFESEREITNELGTWHIDREGHCVWEKGVGEIKTTDLLQGKRTFKWFDNLNIAGIWDTYSEKGSLATIAVLDTGYNKSNTDIDKSIEKSAVIIDELNYTKEQLIIDDRSTIGHGSRCISLVGCRNELQSIIGIAPECKVLAGKISINREIRNFDYILKGIEWAINEGADIISVSYAVALTQAEAVLHAQKFEDLVKDKQVLIFASSGNSDVPVKEERYPASFMSCISVGATDENKNIADFTVLSDKTILHAEGANIESYGRTNLPDAQSGTSYSTPIVAAVAGLAISYLRRKGKEINTKLLLDQLVNTGDKIKNESNKKIINIEKLFEQL
ncbi:MAG TPA: S8/S53 family peptidase [Chitinophagaceae bacterium]